MKTTLEADLIKAYEREYDITLEALPETVRVRGNALASGDDTEDKECEDQILQRLQMGDVWAWFTAKVTVRDKSGREASDYLGCCTYEDAEDFKRGGYYLDMVKACVDELEKSHLAESIQQSTITHLQEIFFDVCDSLNGQTPQDIGYENQKEMLEEFKWKLEAIEEDLRSVFGDLVANPQ